MTDSPPTMSDRDDRDAVLPVMAAGLLRRLRQTMDWQGELPGLFEELARQIDIHRAILFKLREVPGKGFAQSIAAYWVDDRVAGLANPPTVIMQSIVDDDPLLLRLAEEVRQGKIFAGHTRLIEGFLRHDFERQMIKSFLSVAVFAHGHVWGTLAINDCLVER